MYAGFHLKVEGKQGAHLTRGGCFYVRVCHMELRDKSIVPSGWLTISQSDEAASVCCSSRLPARVLPHQHDLLVPFVVSAYRCFRG